MQQRRLRVRVCRSGAVHRGGLTGLLSSTCRLHQRGWHTTCNPPAGPEPLLSLLVPLPSHLAGGPRVPVAAPARDQRPAAPPGTVTATARRTCCYLALQALRLGQELADMSGCLTPACLHLLRCRTRSAARSLSLARCGAVLKRSTATCACGCLHEALPTAHLSRSIERR